MMNKHIFATFMVLSTLPVTGCMVGPDYHRPVVNVPLQYKEAQGWRQAEPQDDLSKGVWWAAYQDQILSSLLSQVAITNQNVAQYEAQYRQARALARESLTNLLPTVSGTLSSTRSSSLASGSNSRSVGNSHSVEVSASWELDLWGKLRRTVEENNASAEASRAELANMTLSAQSELAQDYFQLRIMDQQIVLYQQSVQTYEHYLQVINNKYQSGTESRASVAQAQMQLESARASELDYQWQRAQLEHAIALLIGKTPSAFSLPAAPTWYAVLPTIPAALPATLLQRRPDIAYAERNVAAANAAIGVAIAGYYPDLTLSASGGFSSSVLHNLMTTPNRVWSLGPELSGSLLDFGTRYAQVEQARASYDASVASYRQAVLSGINEVEDYLVEMRVLTYELAARRAAAEAAGESTRVTRDQYEAGMIDYLDVATTENSRLDEQQSLLSLQSKQLITSVKLIVAFGGGV